MIPPSIAPDPVLLRGAVSVLARIEGLPLEAAGVLRFGRSGTVLVEERSVCWATATGMEQRLGELLRHQRNPPLDRRFLESVVDQCKSSGIPLGEALLRSGEITPAGLRSAIFRQAVEAIAHIAREHPGPPEFTPRSRSTYDARFKFAPAEIFAALGARRDHAQATVARRHLESIVTPGTAGVAFLRNGDECVPEVVAVAHAAGARVETLWESSAWALDLFELVQSVDPTAFLAAGTWRGSQASASAVAWRLPPLYFAALCPSRAAAAVLLGRVTELQRAGGLS
jgi:hypothetical protein